MQFLGELLWKNNITYEIEHISFWFFYDSKNISSLCLIAILFLFRGLLLECLLKANSVCEVNIVFFLCVVDSWRSWMNNSADHNYFKRFSDLFRRWMRNSEKQHTLEKIVSATTDIA